MKKRDTVLLLGIFSIIILITIQVVIITGVWREKDEMFNLRYRVFSQDALSNMSRKWSTDGFDTARLLISRYSEKAGKEISALKDDSAIARKKRDVLYFVTHVLDKEQDLSQFLSDYFEKQGIEKNFNNKIVINYFELIKGDTTIPIYVNRAFAERRMLTKENEPPRRLKPKRISEIFVKGDRSEDNFYRLDFEYFIDFTDKRHVILRETAAYLSMSIFSILVVVALFLVTYKNLMEEKRLSNLKTDFINNMTHELKTPLSTITVAGKTLEMAQIREDEAKVLETAKMIGKQSIHLNQLINMILEISMWERTQFQIDKKKVNIEELMNDIVTSFRTGCNNCSSITEKYNFSSHDIDIDVVYFTTLMNNLLSNAVKYSDRDPEIKIDGSVENGKFIISVADNGIGISRNDQKRIFDKFYRASTGNIHKYKGLGLGLYYVKKIAEAHGGDVSVTSKPGKGSIFTVTIPY